jgi:hypothetical protein
MWLCIGCTKWSMHELSMYLCVSREHEVNACQINLRLWLWEILYCKIKNLHMDDHDGYLLIYLRIKQHYGFILLNFIFFKFGRKYELGTWYGCSSKSTKIYLDTWNLKSEGTYILIPITLNIYGSLNFLVILLVSIKVTQPFVIFVMRIHIVIQHTSLTYHIHIHT